MGINVNASPITQVANTTAVGGVGIFGDGCDALAFTHRTPTASSFRACNPRPPERRRPRALGSTVRHGHLVPV